MTGYRYCGCRDCFDVSVGSELCGLCEDAGCMLPDGEYSREECQRPDAYGVE